jgi:NTE family protein
LHHQILNINLLEIVMTTKVQPNELKTLIFSGAGALGFAYAGCIQALEELLKDHGGLENITTYGGSSAGSIMSYALALGYSAKEIKDIIMDEGHTAKFPSFLKCPNLVNPLYLKKYLTGEKKPNAYADTALLTYLYTNNCLSDNEYATKFLDKLCTDKYGTLLTFQQLYDKNKEKKKTLVVTTCDIGTHQEKYNSAVQVVEGHDATPNLLVSNAVLASMSIPFIYPPVNLYPDEDSCVVDGGTLNNLPVDIDKSDYSLYIVMGTPIDDLGKFTKTDGFISFISHLMSTVLNNSYQDIFSQPDIVARTIQVPIPPDRGLGMLSFDMSDDDKKALMKSGYDAVMRHFLVQVNE